MAVGAKIAKTADRKKVMDTTKSTDCPKCGKPTRIVKRVKDRERGIPGGIYISCSACEFFEKLSRLSGSPVSPDLPHVSKPGTCVFLRIQLLGKAPVDLESFL
jgi:hypothetical protein